MPIRIFKEWLRWRRDWDSLCNHCGKCCCVRTVDDRGRVTVHYNKPCRYLDTETHMCRVYENRFDVCDRCGKVTLFTALFNRSLPEECAYRRTFRLWDKSAQTP